MAKATGVDAGGYAVTVVELDGSYKKPRLSKVHSERIAPLEAAGGAGLEADAIAEATAVAIAEAGVPKDGLRFSVPGRSAVLRTIDVPFKGRETIRKVIKGEVEGAIHSHSVDDMVVDFYTVAEYEEGTRVITAAIPKPALRVQLQALDREGLEVEWVNLDAVALFRCAEWCGAFGAVPESAEDVPVDGEGAELPVVVTPEIAAAHPVRVVVDIGARAARVLLVQDGILQEMRTIRLGGEAVSDALAQVYGLSPEVATDAAWGCLVEERDQEVEALAEAVVASGDGGEVAEPAADGDAGEGAAPATANMVTVTVGEAHKAVDRFLMRFQRELQRFLTSAPIDGPIDAVWVTGGGSRWPGVDRVLADVFGVAPRVLPVLDRLQHRLDEAEAARYERELAVAVGLALPGLGGPAGFNFLQEDLAFTKGFDRVKFPLAVFCMVGLFLMVVHAVRRNHELNLLRMEYGATYDGEVWERPKEYEGQTKYQFFGFVGSQVNEGPQGESWFARKDNLDRKDYRDLLNDLAEKPVFERLKFLSNKITRMVAERQNKEGIYGELQIAPGYAVLARFANLLVSIEEQLGRYQIADLELQLPPGDRGRFLKFTIILRGRDMRNKAALLKRAIEADIAKGDGPFDSIDGTGKEKGDFGEGEAVGIFFEMRILLKSDYEPFPEAAFTR